MKKKKKGSHPKIIPMMSYDDMEKIRKAKKKMKKRRMM